MTALCTVASALLTGTTPTSGVGSRGLEWSSEDHTVEQGRHCGRWHGQD